MFITTIKVVLRATRHWLVLFVLAAFGCFLLGGAQEYQNGYWLFTMACWFVLDVYWALAARHTQPAIAIQQKWTILFVTFLIYALYCLPLSSVPLLGQRILPRFIALQTLGALMCALGVGFAIWSRRTLADSWNASVTRGEGRSLVQRGPYAIVRHPIYLGFLIAVIGMVLVLGEIRAFVLLFGIEVLLKKMGQEETILRTAFPDQYPEYEQRVKKLLPGIW